ncbi:hypothetical protein H632_c599p3 [Helicosporidium sp. ATCC 50920]|nr:hypothetical protein H632_c599p3 [Helicosporidium sp. ATCC 50920]|eukprot:KDD75600.1 hypothetical protein H632_c599p3 [Helicosporidium sp. ATCC 50920]
MDAFWTSVASSPSLPEPTRALELKAPTLFERVAWSPPGYASLLFSDLDADAACASRTSLFDAFRDWALGGLLSAREAAFQGLGAAGAGDDEVVRELQDLAQWRRWSESRGVMEACRLHDDEERSPTFSRPLLLTFVSRRPSPTRPHLARVIGNEEELVEALARLRPRRRPVCVAAVDFAALRLRDQALLVRGTDVLVGMHGAALSWSLFMRPEAGLLELWPQRKGVWRCMEHMARWAGARYARWAADGSYKRQVTVVDAEGAALVGLRLLEDIVS